MSLADFLASLAAGGLTYPAANWLLAQLPEEIDRKARFFIVLLLAFGLACGAYGLQVYLGYAPYTSEGLFAAMTVAFTTSQVIWGVRKA